MIYLIGGPPRVGKSTSAARLAAATGVAWIPTDYLASAINPYGHGPDGETRPGRLGGDVDNDERYARFSTESIVANYRSRARFNQLGILNGFVEYAADDDRDFILEGFHLEPVAMTEAVGRWPDRVRCLVLVRSDAEAVAVSLARITDGRDWVKRGTRQPDTYRRIADMVVHYSQELATEAAGCGCPTIDTSLASLSESAAAAVALLTSEA